MIKLENELISVLKSLENYRKPLRKDLVFFLYISIVIIFILVFIIMLPSVEKRSIEVQRQTYLYNK